MRISALVLVLSLAKSAQAQARQDSTVSRHAARIRGAAATHYHVPDSAIAKQVVVKSDTAWVSVRHDAVSITIDRIERQSGRWVFVREEAYGIRSPGTDIDRNQGVVIDDGAKTQLLLSRTTYVASRGDPLRGFIVVASFVNNSSRPVFLSTCGSSGPRFVLESEVNGSWVRSYDRFCPSELRPPLQVLPGEKRVDSLEVSGIVDDEGNARMDVGARHRVVYGASWEQKPEDSASLLPTAMRVSPPFLIETER